MHFSHIDAVLDYEVSAPSHLLLNIEAVRSGAQALISEDLVIEPAVRMQAFCDDRQRQPLHAFRRGTRAAHDPLQARTCSGCR